MSSEIKQNPQEIPDAREKYTAVIIESSIARVLRDSEGTMLTSSDPITLKGYMDLYCRVKRSVSFYQIFPIKPYAGKTRDLAFIINRE